MTKKKPVLGRPTKYTPALLRRGEEYYQRALSKPSAVPTLQGLARACDISLQTVNVWKNEEDKDVFSDLCSKIMILQHDRIIEGGLNGTFNAQVARLMMVHHGYFDKSAVNHESADGSMSPKAVQVTIGGKRLGSDD